MINPSYYPKGLVVLAVSCELFQEIRMLSKNIVPSCLSFKKMGCLKDNHEKSTTQIRLRRFRKYENGHLGGWYIKSILYTRFLD